MEERIVILLLLTCAACAPNRVAQPPPDSSALVLQTFALQPIVLESNDPNPGRFCLVGTKHCVDPSEFRTCLLSTGRCKSEALLEFASAKSRLLLEPPVTGVANPEIIVPEKR